MLDLDGDCDVSDVVFGGVWGGGVHSSGDACLPLRCACMREALAPILVPMAYNIGVANFRCTWFLI
jgi:hypothetical protein